jgi:hypothetical protein
MKKIFATSALAVLGFISGYLVATAHQRSDAAAAAFMDAFTVLAYIHKGESAPAIQILRTKADASLVESEKYNWENFISDKSAINVQWISAYSKLRSNLPPEDSTSKLDEFQSENQEFERKLKAILDRQ